MKLGEYIRTYRTEHGLSQRQFAVRCGLSNGYISMLEKGENPKTHKPIAPTLEKLNAVARAMGLSINELAVLVDDLDVDLRIEKAAPRKGSGQVSALAMELAERITRLSPEKQEEALRFVTYLEYKEDT